MTGDPVYLTLVVEDFLSQVVAKKIITLSNRPFHIQQILGMRGKADIHAKIGELNRSASQVPFIVIVNLDSGECAPTMVAAWFPSGAARKMLFRVAVREVESWILADRDAFAAFLGVSREVVPANPDLLLDPKRVVIELAGRSKRTALKEDLVPRGSASKGPRYNFRLAEFVHERWQPEAASENSPSLQRFRRALDRIRLD